MRVFLDANILLDVALKRPGLHDASGTVHLERAFALGMGDFEDAMQVATAEAAEAQVIVTRNLADFAASPVRVVSPEAFVTLT
ncbi:PIN domain-containing protein [Verrucomicrobium spinosum]|uniref:PIN domain-containing protein n=1 Tax=Verrucomicrobium spinosum TaxID=2736 RepID=UPI0003075355|nr:PIN domain-containing protein [Verrucomicrobium spinosum]